MTDQQIPVTDRRVTQGVYDMPEAEYHADPAAGPSLSSSIAKILLDRTPRHAWCSHPRLNPQFEPEDNRKFDLGTAAHALLLEGRENVRIIDADSYRTKAAQEARDAAYDAGKTPLLSKEAQAVTAMQVAALAQLKAHEEAFAAFTAGQPERTLIWQTGGTWCRARLDWLDTERGYVWDYKTTTSANSNDWPRRTARPGA